MRILYDAATAGIRDKLLTSADDTRDEQQRRRAREEQQRRRAREEQQWRKPREEQQRRKAREEQQRRKAREAYNRQCERLSEVPTANKFDALTMENDK